MAKSKKGILYFFTGGIFGIGWLIDTVKAGIEWYQNCGLCDKGPMDYLPVVSAEGLILKEGEFCCLNWPGHNLKVKNVVTGHKSNGGGISVRIVKGVSVHSGGGGSSVIRQNVEERTPGRLYITNKRIVMLCSKGAFDKPLTALSGITPYKDGIAFQFGSNNYTVLLGNTRYVQRILEAAINGVPPVTTFSSSAASVAEK